MAGLCQSTKTGKVSGGKALLLVLGTAALLLVSDFVLTYLMLKEILVSSRVREIILVGIAAAAFFYLFTHYSLASVYELDGVKLAFSRIYIKNPRLMEQVLLREMRYFGTPEEAEQTYTLHSTKRFTSDRCGFERKALVYERGGLYYRVIFCPNEEMEKAIRAVMKAV